jgi:hypothetical protein
MIAAMVKVGQHRGLAWQRNKDDEPLDGNERLVVH